LAWLGLAWFSFHPHGQWGDSIASPLGMQSLCRSLSVLGNFGGIWVGARYAAAGEGGRGTFSWVGGVVWHVW
jgi:hypothetical protein